MWWTAIAIRPIISARPLFYSGMSYKQIAENMVEMYDIPEPSKATIYRWVKEYTQDALREMENHKAHTGDSWVADEMQVTVGGQKYWNWNVMDTDTRYTSSRLICPSTGMHRPQLLSCVRHKRRRRIPPRQISSVRM